MNLKITLLSAVLLAGCNSRPGPVIDALPVQSSSVIEEEVAPSSNESEMTDFMPSGVTRFEPGVDVECFDIEEVGDASIQTQVFLSPSRGQLYTKVSGQVDSANAQESYMVVDDGRMINWENSNSEVTEILMPEKKLNEHAIPFGELTADGLAFPSYFNCKEWNYDAGVFKHPTPTDTVDLRELNDE